MKKFAVCKDGSGWGVKNLQDGVLENEAPMSERAASDMWLRLTRAWA